MKNKIYEQIKKHQRIIIHRHQRPDGDALGSQIGLKDAIKATFPKKEVYIVGDTNKRYEFMGCMDEVSDEMYKGALVFILDSSEKSLVSDERYKLAETKIKIDHHLFKEKFTDFELVDTSYESCCGLIANFIFSKKMDLTKEGATALYTGIITDSGRFRYDSTSSKTFEICSKLLNLGVDIISVYNNLYIEDLELVKLRAKFVMKFEISPKGVAYIKTTKEELEALNVDVFTVSRSMVNTMAGIKGIDIWANFTEDFDKGVIVELRSSKYNINQIAVKYGGGGHPKASGATVESFAVVDEIIKDLEALIEE